jgi:outer membrane receptor protein involved in Fe transport
MFLNTRLHRVLPLLLLAAAATTPAGGSTVGKISGTVTDNMTGKPLVGASVVILGTTTGAAADPEGRFAILNVPAGTYQVQASVIGYKPLTIDNIQVAPDFTTEVGFSLEQTVLGIIQAIEVTAEKPLIQKDLTGTARFMDRDEIANLPTRGYQEAVAMQAGIVSRTGTPPVSEASNTPRLHVRGGRADEVAYFVDGFSQRDPLTGLSTTSINQNAIDQIVVMTGGFNAEYGKIMSGAVNVITREGGGRYFGSFEAITDNLAGSWVGAKSYDNNTYDLSIGGPVFRGNDRMTFFVSGERRWQADRSPRPVGNLGYNDGQLDHFKNGRLPQNALDGWTWQGKLTWEVNRELKLHAGTLGSTDTWQEYRHEYLLDAAHMPRYEDRNRSYFGTATYSPSPRTFLNFGLNYFYTERYRGDGVFFKDLKGHGYYGGLGNPEYSLNLPIFYYGPDASDTTGARTIGHIWDNWLHRESSYVGGKADLSFQWSRANQAKAGAELRYHTLRRYAHLFASRVGNTEAATRYRDVDHFGYSLTDPTEKVEGGRDGAKHPKDFSLYFQNKYEREQLVVNAGLRYDYMNASTDVLKNEKNPLAYGIDTLSAQDLRPSDGHHKVSPRLGVGFPISNKTQFHANYGIFYQQPNLEDLYVGYDYLAWKVQAGQYYYAFGNPNLKPETTTAYEVGFAHQLADNARFDATAFYKNVRDLVQVQSIAAIPKSYSTYKNTDYGTVKGLDFTLKVRRTNNISSTLNYTFSFANGTGSVANTQHNIAWTGAIPPKQTAPLDFDQRHRFSVNLDWRLGGGAGPTIRGIRPLEKLGVNVLANVASGAPYTPTKSYDEAALVSVNVEPVGSINSRYGPWTYRIDAKIDRGFQFAGLDMNAYVWIMNLLNRRNPIAVYSSTGDPLNTGWLTNPSNAYTATDGKDLYELAQRDPRSFDIPRMVRFGIKTSF